MRAHRAWVLVLVLVLSLSTGVWAEKTPRTVVSGQIHVATADSKGNVLSVEILVGEDGSDQEPYLVGEKSAAGKELKKLVGEWVVVQGVVTEDALGWKTIEVEKYRLAEDFPDR